MSPEKHQLNSIQKNEANSSQESEVSKFYNGKSIFMTGAAGFLGVVILEILLNYCPGIRKIFVLLRSKNGMKPEDRKAEIFKKEIFTKLKENNPDALKKVIVIPGDVSQENLGIDEKDFEKMLGDVSIVFHCAATISFFKPLSFIMNHNAVGTDNVIDFCHRLAKLDALVYTSTLYSNCNYTEIDEKVYKMHFKPEEAVELSRNGDIDGLDRLFSSCDPKFLNFYTFSKCVAENLLADKARDLPVCIVRPGAITCCIKGSMPGYIEDGSLMCTLGLGIAKGVIRVGRVYDRMHIEFITGDAAANVHIVAAYLQATKNLPSPTIYNCTSGEIIAWREVYATIVNLVIKHPVPNSYLIPSVIMCKSDFAFNLYSFIYHYLPAYPIDIFLWMIGSQFRLVKTYKFYERSLEKIFPFVTGKWTFKDENFKSLPEKLNPTDAKMFCVDINDFSLEKMAICLRSGCPFYRVNNKRYEERLSDTLLRYFLTYLIRCLILGSIALVFYMILF